MGSWTRADDVTEVEPPVRSADEAAGTGTGTGTGTGAVAGADTTGRPGGAPRRTRRVTTAPVPGYDPAAPPEPARHRDGENDAQLLRDVPPHW
ncbi:hypothetical protein D8M35_11575 [Curtobacterium sp. HSID17257]|nr:hypothetical protein D8M35_11575 [Curtobacterium sp. HSID17257]